MKTLGFIKGDSLTGLETWMRSLSLDSTVRSSYAPFRTEKWFGYGSNLQNASTNGAIFKTDSPPERIKLLGDKLLAGWHSILVCGGNTSINWHRDHAHFEGLAVMVNLGLAKFSEWDVGDYELTHGQVVEIDTKVLHRAEPLCPNRMNLTFRKIKPQFLPIELSPLFSAH
jgi:hypothetical protein